MSLDLLLTQQASALTAKTAVSGKVSGGSLQDMLFGNLLQTGLIADVKTVQTPVSGAEQDITLEAFDLAQSILALESALFDLVQSKVDVDGSAAQVKISLENIDTLDIDPDLQLILKAYLLGQPLPPAHPAPSANGKVEISAQKTASILEKIELKGSAFRDTDSLTTAESLFEQILGNVLQQLEDQGIKPEQLSATGLTIEQINNLTLKIRSVLETVEDVPQHDATFAQGELLPVKLVAPEKDMPVRAEPTEDGLLSDDLIALLGLMAQPAPQPQTPAQKITLPAQQVEMSVSEDSGTTILSRFDQFQSALKAGIAAGQASKSGTGLLPATTNVSAPAISPAATGEFAGLTNLFGMEFSETSETLTQQWLTPAGQIPSALGHGNAASLVTNAAQAYAPHPATQLVAASIQKNAANGETKDWTLQLDPPELGRIEVRLSFSKDKTVKTHMVIEKPETWLMLQRDAHVLERALQEAGMDGGGNDLSFALARDDESFGRNGQGNGHAAGNGQPDGEDDLATIETTMNWYVDPESGVQRYDLIA